MANMAPIGILAGLVVLIVLIVLYVALNMKFLKDYERILVWKWSGELAGVKGPGAVTVLWPFQRGGHKVDTRIKALEFEKEESCYTKDGARVDIKPVIYFQITDPEKMVTKIQEAEKALRLSSDASLRSLIGGMTIDEAISKREMIRKEVYKGLKDDSRGWGIEVKNVEITELKPDAEVYEKMKMRIAAEREAEAALRAARAEKDTVILRSQGELEESKNKAMSEKIKAKGKSEALKEMAEAERFASIKKAEGESKGIELIKGSFEGEVTTGSSSEMYLKKRWIETMARFSGSHNSKTIIVPYEMMNMEPWKFSTTVDRLSPVNEDPGYRAP